MATIDPYTATHVHDAAYPAGLHPQARRVLEVMSTHAASTLDDIAPSEKTSDFHRAETARRAHVASSPLLVGPSVPIASSRLHRVPGDNNCPDVTVRISVPENPKPGALVYLHGGGWVIGTLDTFDGVCRSLANCTGMTVVAVDYRLAPEHPYPAAIEDSELVLRWIANGGAGDLAEAGPLVLAGDSAGGNLAATISLRAGGEDLPHIAAQVLIYPITDATMSTESMRLYGTGLYLTADAMQWYWDCYLQERREEHHASVLHEPMAGLPPTLVITAEFDPLRDEGEAFASRLKEAGNEVTLRRFNGMIHGFFRFAGLVDAAKEATELIGEFIAPLHPPEQSSGQPSQRSDCLPSS